MLFTSQNPVHLCPTLLATAGSGPPHLIAPTFHLHFFGINHFSVLRLTLNAISRIFCHKNLLRLVLIILTFTLRFLLTRSLGYKFNIAYL